MREYEQLLKLVSRTGLLRLAERHPTFNEMILAEYARRSDEGTGSPTIGFADEGLAAAS